MTLLLALITTLVVHTPIIVLLAHVHVLAIIVSHIHVLIHRKTQVGNVDIVQIRPPRFIGRDGVVRPFSPTKAIGNALLVVSKRQDIIC